MLEHVLLISITAISILLMLVRPRGISEAYWVCGGAALLILVKAIPPALAAKAVAQGTDVYLFLIGMMLLSELAREHGVFEWISSVAVAASDGSFSRLFLLIYAVGTIVTIFMSNDATAVVLTPAVLSAVRKAKVRPLPCLFACALVANAASFVLPISNPANLVVFGKGMPRLGTWLISFGVASVLSIVATYFALRVLFRKELTVAIEKDVEVSKLSGNGKLVLCGLVPFAMVLLAASAMGRDLGLPACLTAVAITIALSIKTRSNPLKLVREISWGTLVLVGGLFVLVDATENAGALRYTQEALRWAASGTPAVGSFAASLVVGVFNNLINNLPLALIAGGTLEADHMKGLMADAILIGVDLGPNLAVTGSLATILWLQALRKEKINVSFLEFFKVGVVAMPIALVTAIAGLVLMQRLIVS